MQENNILHLSEIVGKALKTIVEPEHLNRNTVTYPFFDKTKCVGCNRCYISCRDGGHQAIEIDSDGKPHMDGTKCVGCHLCSLVCPVNAIQKTKRIKKH